MFDGEQTRTMLGRAAMGEAVQLAWRRFSRGLPASISTIAEAIASGARTLEQWNTCMDTATHLMRRSDSHARSRVAIRKPDSIPRKVLQSLETGAELTADEISKAIGGAQIDVVRRALKHEVEHGAVEIVGTRGVSNSRVFAIVEPKPAARG
jgi:urease gamma subunit